MSPVRNRAPYLTDLTAPPTYYTFTTPETPPGKVGVHNLSSSSKLGLGGEAMEMDLDATQPTAPACSICLDTVLSASDGARSVASLLCGHHFHLGQSRRPSISISPSPFSRPISTSPDWIFA